MKKDKEMTPQYFYTVMYGGMLMYTTLQPLKALKVARRIATKNGAMVNTCIYRQVIATNSSPELYKIAKPYKTRAYETL